MTPTGTARGVAPNLHLHLHLHLLLHLLLRLLLAVGHVNGAAAPTVTIKTPPSPARCHERDTNHQTLAQCNYDADCMEDAYCWKQEGCLCKDRFIVYRNRSHVLCLRVATTLGDPCVADVQCQVTFTPRSECRDGVCQCSAGSHFYQEEGRCYESVGLGQKCQTNQNCYLNNTFCDTGYCGCALQHHLSSDNSTCLKDVLLHERCTLDDECVAEHARCAQRCECRMDYVLSSRGDACLKAASQVGEECREAGQCREFLKNTDCLNGTCRCTTGFHQRGPVCLRNVKLGGRCETHRQCVTAKYSDSSSNDVMNVDCVDNVCSCAPDYIMAEELDDCIRYSDDGASGLGNNGMVVSMATTLSLIGLLRLT